MLSTPRLHWQRGCVERVIGSIRRGHLDQVIVFDELAAACFLLRLPPPIKNAPFAEQRPPEQTPDATARNRGRSCLRLNCYPALRWALRLPLQTKNAPPRLDSLLFLGGCYALAGTRAPHRTFVKDCPRIRARKMTHEQRGMVREVLLPSGQTDRDFSGGTFRSRSECRQSAGVHNLVIFFFKRESDVSY